MNPIPPQIYRYVGLLLNGDGKAIQNANLNGFIDHCCGSLRSKHLRDSSLNPSLFLVTVYAHKANL